MDRRIPDEFGYALAEALGVDAYCPLPPGCDGKVFLAEDAEGGILVMKVTTSAIEAALCKAMAEAGDVPGLFQVRDVRSVELPDGSNAWAILRDEVSDVFMGPDVDEEPSYQAWLASLSKFDAGWQLDDADILDSALREAPPEARLDQALGGLRWLRDELGALGRDLHRDNFGRTGRGDVCVRDLSRFRMPMARVKAALRRIDPLPEHAPSPVP